MCPSTLHFKEFTSKKLIFLIIYFEKPLHMFHKDSTVLPNNNMDPTNQHESHDFKRSVIREPFITLQMHATSF